MDVWINQRNTDVGKKTKTSQRKTGKPGDGMNVEIDGLVRSALLDGSGAAAFWQRMARSIARASAMFFFEKYIFRSKSHLVCTISFLLFKPSLLSPFRIFCLDSVTSPFFARPYESHEVTLSIDPAKLGVVAMAPFDGKAECI